MGRRGPRQAGRAQGTGTPPGKQTLPPASLQSSSRNTPGVGEEAHLRLHPLKGLKEPQALQRLLTRSAPHSSPSSPPHGPPAPAGFVFNIKLSVHDS